MYGHESSRYPDDKKNMEESRAENIGLMVENSNLQSYVEKEPFGPWMIVERRQRGKGKIGLSMRGSKSHSGDLGLLYSIWKVRC